MRSRIASLVVRILVAGGAAGTAAAAQRPIAAPSTGRADILGAALEAAVPGDTLVLEPGVYRGSFTLARGVSLRGRAGPDSTILDADGERYVLLGRNLDSTTVILGFTIRNGRRDHPNSGGGGIYLHRSSPWIIGNVLENHLGYLGAGVYANYDSRPVIAYNVFRDNEGYLGGAIAAYQDCAPLVFNNVLHGNRAVSGGAILLQNSTGVVLQNTIAGNRAAPGGGGGIYCDSSPALIAANVIAGNHDPKPDGGAVFWLDADRPASLRDNLLWQNEGGAAGGACPAFLGIDGNCEDDPRLAGAALRRVESAAGCQPAAGARPWDAASPPAPPESVLVLWRDWRTAHR